MTAPAQSSAQQFAGVLASLAVPQKQSATRWDDELADDIATISYEQALRTNARFPSATTDQSLDPNPAGEIATSHEDTPSWQGRNPSRPDRKRLKAASITIRLSEQECAQLRARADEAGLTVSAYLRSCTLEVESLRAQVKETLAQLRQSATGLPELTAPAQPPVAIWRRIWPFGSSSLHGAFRAG